MRRLGGWRIGVVVCAAALAAAAFMVAPAASGGSVAVTFKLVAAPTCGSGTTRLGRACVDRPSIPNWKINDGNARWDMPGQWLTTYSWTVPQTVAATGGGLSLRVSAEERTGRENTRICPALSARAGFTFKGNLAQPVVVGFCAEAIVKPTDTQSKALKLLPSSATPGSLLYLTIGVQDGPSYTYVYRAGAVTKKPKKSCAARRPSALSETTPKCKFIVTYKFDFTLPKLWGDVSAAGVLSGPSPNKLKVDDELSGPRQENLIRLKYLKKLVVLDVRAALYDTPKGVKHRLFLITKVLRSNVSSCPKGADVDLMLEIGDDGAKTLIYQDKSCPGLLPDNYLIADEKKPGIEPNDKLDIDATFRTVE